MNDTTEQESEVNPDDALKRRLLNRIAVAAVMVVGLLGSLAMFDALVSPAKPVPAKMAALPPKPVDPPPVAEVPKDPLPLVTEAAKDESKPGDPAAPSATTATPAGTLPADTKTAAAPEAKPVPETTTSPGAPALQPLPAEKPLTKPATTRPAAVRPSETVPPVTSPAARPDPSRELARAPAATQTPQGSRRAPASRPLTQAAERQFALQMGMFNNIANAEDLRAKLELNGIPATIEARVHAGPFASREEADAARAKLKEMGLDGGLLITMKK